MNSPIQLFKVFISNDAVEKNTVYYDIIEKRMDL